MNFTSRVSPPSLIVFRNINRRLFLRSSPSSKVKVQILERSLVEFSVRPYDLLDGPGGGFEGGSAEEAVGFFGVHAPVA